MFVPHLTNTAGISIIAFIITVAASLAYYQYFYLPEANKKPVVPEEVLNPPQSITVTIVEGSAIPSQERNYVPKQVRGMMGIDNKIVWVNNDTTFHSVTLDTGLRIEITASLIPCPQSDLLAREACGTLHLQK